MRDVYEECPQYENERYLIRFISEEDCTDLLKVYSDKKAVQLFNSDNCHGDDFYYTTLKRVKDAISGWRYVYTLRDFVRFSIVDKRKSIVVGTIELFHRDANDYFTECGLLRLDLRSDYEKVEEIKNILNLIVSDTFELFKCKMIATKAVPGAVERREALEELGFICSNEKLIGHDGKEYGSYYVLERNRIQELQ